MKSALLSEAMDQSSTLRTILVDYALAFFNQSCNRWLAITTIPWSDVVADGF